MSDKSKQLIIDDAKNKIRNIKRDIKDKKRTW